MCRLSRVAVSGDSKVLELSRGGAWDLLLWGIWDLPWPGIELGSSALQGGLLVNGPPRKPQGLCWVEGMMMNTAGVASVLPHRFRTTFCYNEVKWSEVAQSCPTLCDPLGCSLPGSSVHGIFQARILECVAICCIKCLQRLRYSLRCMIPTVLLNLHDKSVG